MNYKVLSCIALQCFSISFFAAQDFELHKHHAAFGSTRPVTKPIKSLNHDEHYQLHAKYLDSVRPNIKKLLELNAEDVFPYQPAMIHFCNTTSLLKDLGTKLNRGEIRARIWLAVKFYTSYALPKIPELQEISREEKNIIAAIESFQKQHRCGRYRPSKK